MAGLALDGAAGGGWGGGDEPVGRGAREGKEVPIGGDGDGKEGQAHGKTASFIGLAFHGQLPLVHLYKFLGDGQADAAALV